jgi:Protein of unknown function (DUF2786)
MPTEGGHVQLTEAPERLLDRVRKLLAQAEDDSVTPAEAQAFTAKAAQLMAKYGIDRALIAAERPETDQPANRVLDIHNPWAREKAHLLSGLATALRCQCILLSGSRPGSRVHLFGFASDIDRTDVLYTSILIQMAHGLATAQVPEWSNPRAWRRSWLLGFATAVIARVREAEHGAVRAATRPGTSGGEKTALVLADRSLIIRQQVEEAYPMTRKTRVTYTGSGYRDGYHQGERADIGSSRLSTPRGRSLTRAPARAR